MEAAGRAVLASGSALARSLGQRLWNEHRTPGSLSSVTLELQRETGGPLRPSSLPGTHPFPLLPHSLPQKPIN